MKKLSTTLFGIIITISVAYGQQNYIAPQLTGADLINHLESNYSVTNSQSYNSARDAMFNSIDKENGQISCVYTGYTITFSNRQDAQNKGFNTEHTWPQSFYDQASPMRTDIHHLFPTRSDVNSARSNYDFDEIPDNLTDTWFRNATQRSTTPTSNIDEYSEVDTGSTNRFEPREDHKGNVARAVFYFWTVYAANSNVENDNTNNEAFFNRMKDVLLQWHDEDPVDSREIDRSIAIESVQGNRNPFIHDTTLVRRAYFGGEPINTSGLANPLNGSITNIQNFFFDVSYSNNDEQRFLYADNFVALDTLGNEFDFKSESSIFEANVYWQSGQQEGEFIADSIHVVQFEEGNTTSNEQNERPFSFTLEQNYPNPFNPVTTIKYALKNPDYVLIQIYNQSGQLIQEENLGYRSEGVHTFQFDAAERSTGIYYYTIRVGDDSQTKRMVLIK